MASAADKLERTRVREVSRYYCATRFPVDNTFDGDITAGSSCNGGPDPLPAADGPLQPVRHSADPAMTAFAQLAALKLDCKRAFINIIDHTTHHVVAEATRTISLRLKDRHGPGEQLYCGLQALPIAWGICPSTIHVFSHPDSEYAISSPNITSNMSYYLIRDLSQEEAYKDRPYIAEWPFMRFYAEVPLKSPAGFVIGSLAIVDDKPREDLSSEELFSLQEISLTIMQHLESVRLEHDYKYACRLMDGLSSFVQTASDASALASTAQVLPRPQPDTAPSSKALNGYGAEQGPTTVFSRASKLIRQSMDLEGVVFFDARKSVSSPNSNKLVCENLGFSTKPDAIMKEPLAISQELLLQLSSKFSTGKIFNFDELGLVTADHDENSSDVAALRAVPETDAALLSATFPGAHSIIFFPLPGAEESCYAGCFGWTFDAKRALQSEEITCFSAFSNSVMSEIFRLEAVAMDRAKSNFISSISHELRSPLHGVLASAELLHACSSGPEQDSLIHMVDTCGRTLLDTMNHLFDYAKITNSSRSGLNASSHQLSLAMSTRSVLDLSQLVEEVVEAVYTGHNFARASPAISPHTNGVHAEEEEEEQQQQQPPVSVILDIAGPSDWVFKSEAGAWRRVVMNLFGNALKYTKTGSIRISLRAARFPDGSRGPRSTMVELQVVDTGRGISQDYLKNRLYTPFAQEDCLSVGTGLGLSIVRGVVTALGGSMDIESQFGHGTTVTVSIPVETPVRDGDTLPLSRSGPIEAIRSKKRTYAFVEANDCAGSPDQSLTKCAIQTLSDWFGLERIPYDSIPVPDLVLAEQRAMVSDRSAFPPSLPRTNGDASSRNGLSSRKAAPDLIVGASSPAYLFLTGQRRNRISQPFGPHKLASSIADTLSLPIKPEVPADADEAARLERPLKRSYAELDDGGLGPEAYEENSESCRQRQRRPAYEDDVHLAGRSPPPSLLLVDDNDINLKIVSTYVQRLACRYTTASNGLEAVECYQKAHREGCPFNIVLMDMSMPIMNGFEATREIRNLESKEKISPPSRIIALTGLTSGKSQQEAVLSGVDLFLTKPVQLRKLKGVLGLV